MVLLTIKVFLDEPPRWTPSSLFKLIVLDEIVLLFDEKFIFIPFILFKQVLLLRILLFDEKMRFMPC